MNLSYLDDLMLGVPKEVIPRDVQRIVDIGGAWAFTSTSLNATLSLVQIFR